MDRSRNLQSARHPCNFEDLSAAGHANCAAALLDEATGGDGDLFRSVQGLRLFWRSKNLLFRGLYNSQP